MAQAVRGRLGISLLIFIPACIPPHKAGQTVTSPEHRLNMLRIAVEGMDEASISETELSREGVSYTIDTVRYFREQYPDAEILFLTGADSLEHLHLWKDVNMLFAEATLITVPRPGCSLEITPLLEQTLTSANVQKLKQGFTDIATPDISSTMIRKAVEEGRDISGLVPAAVQRYISEYALYTA
jgi:nicotinate-nucleotide adenylyltransferase